MRNPGSASSTRSNLNTTEFAKATFSALAKGDQSVADDIDWESFQVSTENVGSQYTKFSGDADRAAFRKSFISSFSTSFHSTGANEDSLSNWKIQSEGGDQSVVSGETVNKSHLLITVSKKNGVQKMSAIQNSQ